MEPKTPLDTFIDTLRTAPSDRHESQREVIHTSEGFSAPGADVKCEAKCEGLLTLPDPGSWITWQRADGTQPAGLLDFTHIDQDGCCWLFVTLLDGGWAAVNRRYMTGLEVRPS